MQVSRPLLPVIRLSPTFKKPKRFCFRSEEEEIEEVVKMLDDYKTENIEADAADVEKQQEMLLMNKLQAQGKNPPKPQSTFLQKKLQQRVSLFFYGDRKISVS